MICKTCMNKTSFTHLGECAACAFGETKASDDDFHDRCAIAAMQSLIGTTGVDWCNDPAIPECGKPEVAETAFDMADAMLAERKRRRDAAAGDRGDGG